MTRGAWLPYGPRPGSVLRDLLQQVKKTFGSRARSSAVRLIPRPSSHRRVHRFGFSEHGFSCTDMHVMFNHSRRIAEQERTAQ
jgi:hypothetical protein